MSPEKAFFDTNVLVYAFTEGDPRCETARALLAGGGLVGVQILNEFVAVAKRKLGMPWEDGLESLDLIRRLCPFPVPLTLETHENALRIAGGLRYQIYDALVIAAALRSGCTTLYTEDLCDGQVIEGLTIRNPFGA